MALTGRTLVSVPGYSSPIEFGTLTYFAYPVDGSDQTITVATTRLETMLGDTGIAVHPEDERYCRLIGQSVVHPFSGRRLPIVGDESVDREYGTGAVKITPAHDYSDYDIGRRHRLESLSVIDEGGNVTEAGREFKGMRRFDARLAVLQALKDRGLYRKVHENPMNIPICSRSGDVVEPLLKSQWFVRCTEMAQRALTSVETGNLEIAPQPYVKMWRNWLTDVRDWCISRQLWWGHRIPAYQVTIDGKEPAGGEDENSQWVSGQAEEEALEKAARRFRMEPHRLSLRQDDDVLDTWFSSALFPFAVHGWPEQTEDLRCFYPSSLLETGYDILFFWVARMVMMGQQLTGRLPFKKVCLHAMVRDAHGRKMSKSLGNVVDPLDVVHGVTLEELQTRLSDGNIKLDPKEMEAALRGQQSDFPHGIPECGTDALRFALASYNSQGQDVNLGVGQVLEYRHFCNKIWNATRLALSAFDREEFKLLPTEEIWHSAGPMDRWILSRFSSTVQACHRGFSSADLPLVTGALYRFWLHNLCDVYLECVKQTLNRPQSAEYPTSANVLHTVVEGALRLLHPIMPYLTEELFQRLPRRQGDECPSICVAPYPSYEEPLGVDEAIEGGVAAMLDVVHTVRSLEGMLGLKRGQSDVGVICQDHGSSTPLDILREPLAALVRSSHVSIIDSGSPPPGSAALAVGSKGMVYLQIKEASSAAAASRLEARCSKVVSQIGRVHSAMAVPSYADKVPLNIQHSHKSQLEELEAELRSLENLLSSLRASSVL